ncbi:hypothetical protein AB205_0170500 [Aquarana catesbeiana]|nr:hypothetical protein AB205_0170500 [Aquarana catesbeiana]
MFHIPISGLKYLCAKYTFCFTLKGKQRLGKYEDTRDPHHLLKKGNKGHNLRMWRKEMWWRLSPQQVMFRLWYQNLVISPVTVHNGWSRKSCFVVLIWTLSKKKTKEIEQRLKNMIDVLGRI